MKKILVLTLLTTFCTLTYAQTAADKTTLLTSHKWKSVKTLNNGKDVTSMAEPLTYEFKADGTSIASSSVGSKAGTWKFDKDGTMLIQDKVIKWEIVELTVDILHVKQSSRGFSVEIWYSAVQ